MPAAPRLGDGWRAAYAPDVVDQQLTVVTRDHAVGTPAGRFPGALGLDVSDPLSPDSSLRAYYARGVGLVEAIGTGGIYYRADLAADSATGAG